MIEIPVDTKTSIQIEPDVLAPGRVVLGLVSERSFHVIHTSLSYAQVQALITALQATAAACAPEAV